MAGKRSARKVSISVSSIHISFKFFMPCTFASMQGTWQSSLGHDRFSYSWNMTEKFCFWGRITYLQKSIFSVHFFCTIFLLAPQHQQGEWNKVYFMSRTAVVVEIWLKSFWRGLIFGFFKNWLFLLIFFARTSGLYREPLSSLGCPCRFYHDAGLLSRQLLPGYPLSSRVLLRFRGAESCRNRYCLIIRTRRWSKNRWKVLSAQNGE